MLKFGWRKELADFRDLTADSPEIKTILDKSDRLKATKAGLPLTMDLRPWCSPIEDQGNLGSCTANAGVGLLEYYQKRAFGKYLNASRLFLYKATRDLEGFNGDTGAYLRDVMKALVLFGVPPESYWPYDISKFDTEPSAFLYALANNYKSIKYYRLDPAGTLPGNTLINIKTQVAAGLPCMFGFTVYSSISYAAEIPFPTRNDSVLGGHAICCVGYDDNKTIGSQKGAMLIRNSWGTSWGNQGYGWLPYAYVTYGLASDFWTLVQANFVDTDLFK
jgi:C1A family cysteine protease